MSQIRATPYTSGKYFSRICAISLSACSREASTPKIIKSTGCPFVIDRQLYRNASANVCTWKHFCE